MCVLNGNKDRREFDRSRGLEERHNACSHSQSTCGLNPTFLHGHAPPPLPSPSHPHTCAVQMFDVALSRLMCCSRVCMAMRSARLPCASIETPMMRPGMMRLTSSWQARKAAWGPP